MSFQKHLKRNEIWLVSQGSCKIKSAKDDPNLFSEELILKRFDHFIVPLGHWHQILNPFNKPVHIIEIQYGSECVEDDIVRQLDN